jgi:hypothetical protein
VNIIKIPPTKIFKLEELSGKLFLFFDAILN